MKKSVGFIGGGRVTRILLQAFRNENSHFSKTVVADTNKVVTDNLKGSFPELQIDDAASAASQDIVFIALHPPVIMDTLESLKDIFREQSTVISLAPKITIGKISTILKQVNNIARLIPNATSFINEGYNPVCFSSAFSEDDKVQILDVLRLMGNTFEVTEEKLECYAIMSAMLPTYFWFQWKELAEIGIKMGLTKEESVASVSETLYSSLNLMYKSRLTANEVMDLIPVKPLGGYEAQINEIYQTQLLALFEKIKP